MVAAAGAETGVVPADASPAACGFAPADSELVVPSSLITLSQDYIVQTCETFKRLLPLPRYSGGEGRGEGRAT